MELSTAISLIEGGVSGLEIETWADLGAGEGLFTRALATLLQSGSTINAVDSSASSMSSLTLSNKAILLTKVVSDFRAIEFNHLDGVLMANSLHFVQDQVALLKRLKTILQPKGQFVVVEYDSDRGNTWVPYPLSFETLNTMVQSAGFSRALRLRDVPSRYGRANIYSAKIEL